MLSLTLFSSQFSLFQQSSLLNIQPLQSPKHSSKTINSNYQKNPNDCRCFYRETTNSHTNFHKSSDDFSLQDNADAESSHAPSVSQSVDSNLLAIWLRSCNTVKQVKRIHAIVLKSLRKSVLYVDNNLISVYVKLGKLVEARKVFDKMSERNVVSWTAMVNGYSRFGFVDEAFMLFSESIRTGVRGNEKMFVCVMNLCGRRLDFELGRQIHASILKCHCRNLIVDSAILHFYAQFGDFSSAFCAFDGMSERDVVSWTAMITACSQQARGDEAIFMFSRMLSEGFLPNEFTVCSVLKACGEERALKLGRQLHAAIVKKLYKDDVFIRTSLVDMYAKCGEILDSRRVFDEMGNRNTVTWTSIIAGYAREGLGEEAIGLFRVMKRRKIHANNLTIVSILKACGLIGAFQLGKEVHAQIIKNFIQSNEHIGSTLVWFYCKNGEFPVASKVLQQMPLRDVVSWTAIISGYACLGHESEALDFLKDMLEEGVEPNPFTYSSALKACAKLENVSQGMLIHSSVKKTTSLSNVYVGSALINMYAKCGYISEASQVFDNMPERNLFTWKSMIVGYARNGLCQEALKLMYRIGKHRRFLKTDGSLFVATKAFAAGVILATGFVHMLSGGSEALDNPCLPEFPWSKFPFPGFFAMVASLLTLLLDFVGTQYYERKQGLTRATEEQGRVRSVDEDSDSGIVPVLEIKDRNVKVFGEEEGGGMHIVGMHAHAAHHRHNHPHGQHACEGHVKEAGHEHGQGLGHGHSHGFSDGDEESGVRHVVVSQVLELGIVSHSIIIGISLGVSHSPCTIRPLIAALSFHQFFEGFALGGCISQAQFKTQSATLMACFFALTTPVGISIGTAAASVYNPNSPGALIVEGILDSMSAGILVYMALVDLIAADFLSKRMSCNFRLQVVSYLMLFLGAGLMSLLAIWA